MTENDKEKSLGNEPAFPAVGLPNVPPDSEMARNSAGMTKREYIATHIAAAAYGMVAILRLSGIEVPTADAEPAISFAAIRATDALLAELEKKP